jgi:hypothetical protein
VQDRAVGDVLPLDTLQHVRDLTLSFFNSSEAQLEWPTTWNHLLGMTKLKLDLFQFGSQYETPLKEHNFLKELRGLVDLEVRTIVSPFDELEVEYLVHLVGCLPKMTKLVLNGIKVDLSTEK